MSYATYRETSENLGQVSTSAENLKASMTEANKAGFKRGVISACGALLAFILVIALVILGRLALDGYSANVEASKVSPILQIRGQLVGVKSFEVFSSEGNVSFKYLWLLKVEESESVSGLETKLPALKAGDTISVEIKDSRANLFVTSSPVACYRADGSAVRVCDYEINKTVAYATVFITEVRSASSGQYELAGTPR